MDKQAKAKDPRDLKKDLIYAAIVMLVVGLLFAIFPNVSIALISYILGALLCVWGVVRIFAYFKEDRFAAFGSYGLLKGLAPLIVGIVIIANPNFLSGVLTVLFGVVTILDGVVKIQYGIDLMRVKAKGWIAVLIIAIVMTVLGIVAVCNPFATATALTVFSGIILAVDGATDLVAISYIKKVTKTFVQIGG